MTIKIEPSDATLGATVSDVDLNALSDKDWQEIHTAFLEYALLIFPGQHLSPESQAKFARRFGEIEVLVGKMQSIPLSNKDDNGEFLEEDSFQMKLLGGNEGWHTDSSYMPLSAKASVLSAHVVPSEGGATEWADPRAAYTLIDEATRQRIGDLAAYHNYFRSQAKIGHDVAVGAGYGFFEGESPLHPLVKIHPETGVPALYIGRHAGAIPGLSDQEAEALIEELMSLTCQPPRTLLHQWEPGDLAVWDNRCVLHRARPYDHREERVMVHTRIRGDVASESALNA